MEDKSPQVSEGGFSFELRRVQIMLIVILMVVILLFISEVYYFHQSIGRLERAVMSSIESVPAILSKTKRRLDAIMKVEELRLKIEAMEKAGELAGELAGEGETPPEPDSPKGGNPSQAK